MVAVRATCSIKHASGWWVIVLLANWDLADIVGVAHLPSIPADRGVIGIARLHAVCFSIPGGVAAGDHRPPPPTWRTATLGEETEAQSVRPRHTPSDHDAVARRAGHQPLCQVLRQPRRKRR